MSTTTRRLRAAATLVLALAMLGEGAGPKRPSGEGRESPSPEGAIASCAARLSQRLDRHYAELRDLSARFVQRSERVALEGGPGSEEVTSGRVVLAKPGKMRWDYEKPRPSLVVSDGEWVWIYDPQAREVQRMRLGPDLLSSAGVQLLFGRGRPLEGFIVERADCTRDPARLVLAPREPSSFERLVLEVDPARGRVLASELTDLLGNRTRVEFRGIKENRGPPERLFHFVPPPGVRVIDVPGAQPEGSSP